jgi:hypothetical protein
MSISVNCIPNPEQERSLALMVSLAFPDRQEDHLFLGEMLADLCHQYLRMKWDFNTPEEIAPQMVKPINIVRDPEKLEKNLKQFDRRMQIRLHAAKMAMAILQEAQAGERPKTLPKHITKISLSQLSDLIYEDTHISDHNYLHKHYWLTSLPVIHLATAFAGYMDELYPNQENPVHLFTVIDQPRCLETLIRYAKAHSELLCASKTSTISLKQLHQFH